MRCHPAAVRQHSLITQPGPQAQLYPTIEREVGRTALVRLQRLPGRTSNVILAKLEGDNPAGSVKDRCRHRISNLLVNSGNC